MPSILIVDDEADVRQILGEMVQRFGYDVRVAATAAEALAATRAERPDAILLDIALPDANERRHSTACAASARTCRSSWSPPTPTSTLREPRSVMERSTT
jgi:CheY-like chemotaxis protein